MKSKNITKNNKAPIQLKKSNKEDTNIGKYFCYAGTDTASCMQVSECLNRDFSCNGMRGYALPSTLKYYSDNKCGDTCISIVDNMEVCSETSCSNDNWKRLFKTQIPNTDYVLSDTYMKNI